MPNTFIQNQKGGVSPQFAILISAVFIIIGSLLYFQSETAYSLFDNMVSEIRYITNR